MGCDAEAKRGDGCPAVATENRRVGYRRLVQRIALALSAAALLAGCGSHGLENTALADPPVTVTESVQPPAGFVFTDNPAIMNGKPLQVDSWSRTTVSDAVTLHFTIASPDCTGVHATVQETPKTLRVTLLSGTLSDAVGRMCTMIAGPGTLDVPLQNPLDDRTVLSSY